MLDKFSIGQASEICHTSIQALRYYDRIGLVIPSFINPSNGYRYYTNNEILKVKIIQGLRGMDFSLDSISDILKNDNLEAYEKMLTEKKLELENQKYTIENTIKNLDLKIHNIRMYKNFPELESTNFETRHISDRKVIFCRKFSPCNAQSFMERSAELLKFVGDLNIQTKGTILTVYHDDLISMDRGCADIELCLEVNKETCQLTENVRTIPSGTFLIGVYKGVGSKQICDGLYKNMLEWINKSNYSVIGSVIEEFIVNPIEIQNDNNFITEIQIPIEK